LSQVFLPIMKTQNILIVAGAIAALLPLSAAHAGLNTGLIDVGGNAATSSAPVSGVSGSGAARGQSTRSSFEPALQAKVDAAGASLSAESISGSQTVGSGSVTVDPAAAKALIEVINSPAGSNPEALASLVTSLGGGESGKALASSLLGLRGGNGAINASVLSGAVTAYNSYLNGLVSAGNVVGKPTSELDAFLQGLPAGQKATQVLLTKLLAG
jgi:hypothetical protein